PGFAHLSHEAWCKQLLAAIGKVEAAAAAERQATGRRIVGRRAIRDQSPFVWPDGREPRRNLRPQVACRSKWHRIEALARKKEFVEAYAAAWKALKAGVRNVVFPVGTYLLRVRGLVTCPPSGASP